VELTATRAGFSREGVAQMLWQPCRRSFLRRTLKFRRAVGRPTNLDELFDGQERAYRRPRAKRRSEKGHGPGL